MAERHREPSQAQARGLAANQPSADTDQRVAWRSRSRGAAPATSRRAALGTHGMTKLVPNPCGSDEEHARYFGDDLAHLDDDGEHLDKIEIRVELRRIERALATSHRRQRLVERDWLRDRHARLRAVLRQGAARVVGTA
jgi:hypothetical protein